MSKWNSMSLYIEEFDEGFGISVSDETGEVTFDEFLEEGSDLLCLSELFDHLGCDVYYMRGES